MSSAATSRVTLTMKVLIDTGDQRVLYAEAGKDVVDFIFGFLAMPIGSVVKLLADVDVALGSIGNVYASVEKLDAAHMVCPRARSALLPNPAAPACPSYASYTSPPPPNKVTDLLSPPQYTCYPSCSVVPQTKRGYVKGVSMYTIMDDLTVAPASSMLLSKLGVKDLTGLEERTVNVGSKEGLEILKAAFHSKTVLTYVFLAKKKRARTDSDTKEAS